ncbi:MAG: ribonuclease HI [Gemmatimonadaceae bacterium]|nr:ribonuclease HI [Gemmatimonadaceae bacterium]
MSAELPLLAIYADESCLGNGREGENPGGAGALIEYRTSDGMQVRRDLWIAEPATTNNRMALRSVIESFTAIGRKGSRFRVTFVTDSRYIVDGMTRWVHDWARRDWRRKSGPIENLELWREAVRAARDHQVAWTWVRGHNGHAQNEYANDLAVRAARSLTSSDGLVESGFDAWLASTRGAGMAGALEAFPDGARFRAAPALP